ncbi:MAG: transglutaminase domain-containing protein [Hyphomicrobium sp.]
MAHARSSLEIVIISATALRTASSTDGRRPSATWASSQASCAEVSSTIVLIARAYHIPTRWATTRG